MSTSLSDALGTARRLLWWSDGIDKGYPVRDEDGETRYPVGSQRGPLNSIGPVGVGLGGPGHAGALAAVDTKTANCVSSQCDDGKTHMPAIDLDLPCELIESSTPGHYHLLIDKPMPWFRYRVLLRAMVFAGLVEDRYYRHSVRRGQTFLRLPHVKKGQGLVRDEV
jgi:hypothetical protein